MKYNDFMDTQAFVASNPNSSARIARQIASTVVKDFVVQDWEQAGKKAIDKFSKEIMTELMIEFARQRMKKVSANG